MIYVLLRCRWSAIVLIRRISLIKEQRNKVNERRGFQFWPNGRCTSAISCGCDCEVNIPQDSDLLKLYRQKVVHTLVIDQGKMFDKYLYKYKAKDVLYCHCLF